MTDYTPTDSLRYISAAGNGLLDYAIDTIGQWSSFGEITEDHADEIQSILEQVQHMIREAVAAHTIDPHTYADGRRVQSRLEMELGNIYVHTWHADLADRSNQPHQIGPHECTSGAMRTIIVNGPGHLDVLHNASRPTLRVVD